MAWAEPLAYGLLALKPWELEKLQPYEFLLMVEGAVWRRERQEDILAYFVTPLINVQLDPKKQIKMETLIKPLRSNNSEKTKEEQKYFKEAFGLE